MAIDDNKESIIHKQNFNLLHRFKQRYMYDRPWNQATLTVAFQVSKKGNKKNREKVL